MTEKSPASSRVDDAVAKLRARIESRELMPGEAVRLDALSQQLEMSVQPIREALRILESEGLVERSLNRGVVVTKMSMDQVIELSCLRTIIEPIMVSLAAIRANPEEIAAIRQSHEEIRALVDAHTPWDQVLPSTIAWHLQIYAAARSSYLSDFLARIWAAIRINSAWRNAHAAETIPEHEAIIIALEARDARAAAESMRHHVRESVLGHLEGYSGPSGPAVSTAIATFDALLSQIDPSTVESFETMGGF